MQEAILEQVYAFIEDYIHKVDLSPTVREVAIGCKMSVERTLDALSFLEARRKIERVEGTHRSIRIPTHAVD